MTTEEIVSDTLLNKAVRFKIKVSSPGILCWIGIRTIRLKIRDIHRGTLYMISPILAKIKVDISKEGNHVNAIIKAMDKDIIRLQSECIAMAILDGPVNIWLWKKPLTWFLTWNLDSTSASQLTSLLLDKMNIMDFMKSIISTGGLQVLKNEMSPESDTGEIIAPGIGKVM